MKKISVRDLCLIGLFAALMAILSQLSIPMPYGVPITLQTLIIPFAGMVLGAKRGTIAAIVYVLLGLFGLPVFAEFNAGPGIVFGLRGGFILSFPLMALAAGLAADKGGKVIIVLGLVAGAAINYLCGMAMYCFVTSSSVYTGFIACVLPFIPTAIIKIAACAILGTKIRSALEKSRLLV